MIRTRIRSRFGQKCSWLTLKAILYASWALGIFPFTFNVQAGKMHRSRWLLAYGMVLNVGIICLGLQQKAIHDDLPVIDPFERHPLLGQINYLSGFLTSITVCVTILRTFWRSHDQVAILNELLLMEQHLFSYSSLDACPKFDCYVIQKGLATICLTASSLFMHFALAGLQMSVMLVMLTNILLLAVHLVIVHFYMGVVYIYRFIWKINRELLELVHKLRVDATMNYPRISVLIAHYKRLLELNTRLTAIYDFQMVLTMTTCLCYNIIVAFFFIVFSISIPGLSTFMSMVVFPQAMIAILWDFWLTIAACELAERTACRTSEILKLYNDINGMDVELERTLENFALFCCHEKLKFFQCGLFYVNYSMGFEMIVTSVLYLLFLVQFDFMNL